MFNQCSPQVEFFHNSVPIVFECSGYYAPYLDIAIKSILQNASTDWNYDILILEDGIDPYDKELVLKNADRKDNVSIRFFDPTSFVEDDIRGARQKYIKVNYYRMALPWILQHYEKVINLGVDVLVQEDLSLLLSVADMNEHQYIAGVKDLGWVGRLKKDIPQEELNLLYPQEYVNADVLVLDLSKIRRDCDRDEIVGFWQQCQFRCAEQDCLNKLFDGKKMLLDMRWNLFPDRMLSTEDIMLTSDADISCWRECLKEPFIVHYAAIPKPWDYPTVGYGVEWWAVARTSPYYEEILRRMPISCPIQRNFHYYFMLAVDLFLPLGTRRRSFFKLFKSRKKETFGFYTK